MARRYLGTGAGAGRASILHQAKLMAEQKRCGDTKDTETRQVLRRMQLKAAHGLRRTTGKSWQAILGRGVFA